MMGSLSGMNSTFYAFCSHMSGGSTFLFGGSYVPLSPHLVVNGSTYYGPSCGVPLFVSWSLFHCWQGMGGGGIIMIITVIIIIIIIIKIVTVTVIFFYNNYDDNNSDDNNNN